MKTNSSTIKNLSLFMLGAFIVTGCSSMPGQKTSAQQEISSSGPSILNARVEPSTIELNQKLQPVTTAEVLADVKDFETPVREVTLRFLHVPLQVAMQRISGTTWRAVLTPEQLQMLAVSGKTMTYDATIVAKNEKGQVSLSPSPVTVAVKAPDVSKSATT